MEESNKKANFEDIKQQITFIDSTKVQINNNHQSSKKKVQLKKPVKGKLK